jgi:hypothetical protein
MVQELQRIAACRKESRRGHSSSINRSIDDWQVAVTYTLPQRRPF